MYFSSYVHMPYFFTFYVYLQMRRIFIFLQRHEAGFETYVGKLTVFTKQKEMHLRKGYEKITISHEIALTYRHIPLTSI